MYQVRKFFAFNISLLTSRCLQMPPQALKQSTNLFQCLHLWISQKILKGDLVLSNWIKEYLLRDLEWFGKILLWSLETDETLWMKNKILLGCIYLIKESSLAGQMFLLDRFFDGTFFTYGIEVMSFADRDQEDRIDPMIYVFPRYSNI